MISKKPDYSKKLLDARWQKKRLEIMGRDCFTCQKCQATDHRTLHVHHRHYLFGRDPWDYPNELLVTLCATCHKQEEDCANLGKEMFETLHYWGFFNTEIQDELNKLIAARMAKTKELSNPITNQ